MSNNSLHSMYVFLQAALLAPVQRRKLLKIGANLSQRYSEPPQNHPYYPLRDMHSIEELSR